MAGTLPAATFCATLLDEWVAAGLTDAVVCPGSRSTPMALALAEHPGIRVHVHVDERAGAFVALGLSVASRRPVAVLTTSGTAAVELHPAVVEASYAAVPLIALTADRPPELQGVGAPQTIDQRGLFGSFVRAALDPGPAEDGDPQTWRPLARQVWAAATGAGVSGSPPGPVQLNLAFREPLLGEPGELPAAIPVSTPHEPGPPESAVVARLAERLAGQRVLVVAGGGIEDPEGVLALADAARWPVLADPRSGCRRPTRVTVAHADALLRHAPFRDDPASRPEVVLRLGRPWSSKVLGQWLAGLSVPQVLVEGTGLPADPDGVVDEVVLAEPGGTCRGLESVGVAAAPVGWLERWTGADRVAAEAIADEIAEIDHGGSDLCEPGIARAVAAVVPAGGCLVVSSSMPIRDVEWYAPPRTALRVLANRGANGIDGVVSTAVGVALAGGPTFALVGDLAFLHDTNGLLGAAARDVDLTIVVVDNDGGGIFSFLPPREELDDRRYEQLFGTPHGVDLAAVAWAHGVRATTVADAAGLERALARANEVRGLTVVVGRTWGREFNRWAHGAIHDAVAAALVGGSTA